MIVQKANYLNIADFSAKILGIPDSILRAAQEKVLQRLKEMYPDKEFDLDSVIVNSFKFVSWPDAALGCPEEGKSYAQVLTPGFVIELSCGDQTFQIHTNADGSCIVSPDFQITSEDLKAE